MIRLTLAQINYHKRLIKKNKRSSITALIEKYIRTKLKLDWSPEQIAGRMGIDKGISIHHETIEFANISKEEIVTIANKLNHRPRKSLGFKTPFEVFMSAFSKQFAA